MNQTISYGNTNEKAFDMSKHKTINVSMVLLLLYIFFLFTAQKTLIPPVVHSVVMYLFIGWTMLSVILSRGKFLISNYTIWYLALIVLCIFSFAWATETVTGTLYTMFVSLVITGCIIYTVDSKNKLELCIHAFVISADVMCLMILATGQLVVGLGEDRLGEAITGNANSFSALLMMAAVFASWLLIYKTGKWSKAFNLVSLLLLLYTMAISGGRKTIITVAVCLIYFILARDSKKALKTAGNILKIVVVLLLLYLAIMKIPALYEAIGQRFEQLFAMLHGGTSAVNSDNLREKLVQLALQEWTNRPFFGYGLDTFKYFNQFATGHFYYAHNNYAEILYDLGVAGFAIYYGYIGNMFYKLSKISDENRIYKILGIGLIFEVLMYDIGGISYYTVMTQILLCITFRCILLGKSTDLENRYSRV